MAKNETSGVSGVEQRKRGRPGKSTGVDNKAAGEQTRNLEQAATAKRPARDTYKVWAIRISAEIEACVVRHGKETTYVMLNANGDGWKPLIDKESIFYRMIERAGKSKKNGARLVGVYYDPNIALLPQTLPAEFIRPGKPTDGIAGT